MSYFLIKISTHDLHKLIRTLFNFRSKKNEEKKKQYDDSQPKLLVAQKHHLLEFIKRVFHRGGGCTKTVGILWSSSFIRSVAKV